MAVKYLTDKSSDGWSIGQTITDKISFYGVTPVIQRSGVSQVAIPSTGTLQFGTSGVFGFSSSNAAVIPVLINEIRATLVENGLMAGA